MLGYILLLLSITTIVKSQSIIKTLPGFDGDLPFNLETGYVSVGEKEEVQLFYYFFESERNPKEDPLLLWLTGGPGCSALIAVLYQNGPLTFNYTDTSGDKPALLPKPYSWTKVANMIFLDLPVGTGFSYATTWKGYKTGDLSSAADAYEFLKKWLLKHPKFLSNPCYVGSDSYGGIFVPMIVEEISNGNDKAIKPAINLKGFVLGNPLTDFKNDISSRIEYAHHKEIISHKIYEGIKENCKGEYIKPDRSNKLCIENLQAANKTLEKMYLFNILEPKCRTWDLGSLLGDRDLLTILKYIDVNMAAKLPLEWCRDYTTIYCYLWANDKSIQKALHVREGTIELWPRCNISLWYEYDVHYSSNEYQRRISKRDCHALIFSGDRDLAIPYVGTYAWIQSLELQIKKNWHPWFVDGQLAGYAISYSKKKYNLTFAIVKGGSHSAPEIAPKECFAMIDRWFSNYSL